MVQQCAKKASGWPAAWPRDSALQEPRSEHATRSNRQAAGVHIGNMLQDACALACVNVDAHAALLPELRYVQHQDAFKDDHLGRVNLCGTAAMQYSAVVHMLVFFFMAWCCKTARSCVRQGTTCCLQQASQCR